MKSITVTFTPKEIENIIDAMRYADRYPNKDSELRKLDYEIIAKLRKTQI